MDTQKKPDDLICHGAEAELQHSIHHSGRNDQSRRGIGIWWEPIDWVLETSHVHLPSSLSLESKSAIVTGASRGIGKAIAIALAHRGANIAIIYTSENSTPAANRLVQQIQALGPKACRIQVDLQDADCGQRVVQAALSGLGVATIEILINNAAIGTPPTPSEVPYDTLVFERIMHVNVRAPMLLVSALLLHLGPEANRIINISSINSRLNSPGFALYSASKAALESLNRSWARELAAKYHLTSNAVLVGTTATADAPESEARSATAKLATAEHRMGVPDDITEIVAWLSGEGSRWVNGDTIGANGGIFMQ